nr:transmembrane 9 superfamily member 4 [Quercus suber]
MARRILNTCYLVLVLVALSTVAFAIVWTQRSAPLSEEDRDDDDEEYKEGDYIPLFANKACPYQGDPCEPYSYFDFPFCPPEDPIPNRKKSFQELLAGDCYVNTQYELRFKMGTTRKLFCEKNLTREEVAKFRDAIANETMYEMYYDNIRLEEQVGVNASDLDFPPIQYQVGLYLINHLDFHILNLGNKVKAIYVMGHYDFSGEISKDAEIIVNFTCSVFWEDFESKQENQDELDVAMMIKSTSTAGILLVITAGVLGTRPYLGPFWVLELSSSLSSILDLLDLHEVFISSWHGATVSGGALAIDGGSGKGPLQNSFLV